MAYEVKVTRLIQATDTVYSLYFEKPAGFNFLPGQFINLEIPVENPDNRGAKHNFSIASSPTDEYLMISFRRGVSSFKKAAVNLTPGTILKFVGPLGRFVLNEDPKVKAVMLSGGIGITPIHSMVKYTTVKNLSKEMLILYSNQRPVDVPFKQEMDHLDAKNRRIKIEYFFTRENNCTGRIGRIDETAIKQLVPSFEGVEFYIVGPPQMVAGLRQLLKNLQVPDAQIKFEQFTGY